MNAQQDCRRAEKTVEFCWRWLTCAGIYESDLLNLLERDVFGRDVLCLKSDQRLAAQRR